MEIPCPHGAHTPGEADNETLCSEVKSGMIGGIRCWG